MIKSQVVEDPFKPQLEDLANRRATMISYLKLKLHEEDWHGVQDAASDLRDIDTEIATLERVNKNVD